MITGDHKITTVTIAEEIGIYKDGDKAATGIWFRGKWMMLRFIRT